MSLVFRLMKNVSNEKGQAVFFVVCDGGGRGEGIRTLLILELTFSCIFRSFVENSN